MMIEKLHMDPKQKNLRQAEEFDKTSVVLETVALEVGEAVKRMKAQIDDLTGKLESRDAEFQTLVARLEAREVQIAELMDTLSRKQDRQEDIERLQKEKEHLYSLLNLRDFEIKNLRTRNESLMQLIEKLETGITRLLRSKRWKTGNALGELKRKLLFQPRQPMPAEYIENVLLQYRKKRLPRPAKIENKADQIMNFNEYLRQAMLNFELIQSPINEQARRVISYMDCLKNKLVEKYINCHQTDLVSIIMPTYNRAHVIREAIASVQKQTYKNWELIIIDDNSEDDTAEVVNGINDHRIHFLQRKENGGASKARNDGLSVAQGEWIAYLDTDDLWDPNFLLIMINELKAYPALRSAYSAQLVWHSVPNLNESGDFLREEENKLQKLRFGPFNRSLLENHNRINTNSFVHHRSLYEKYGGWPEDMRRLVDWHLILRYTADLPPLAIPVILSHNIAQMDRNRITLKEDATLAHKGIDHLLFQKNLLGIFSNKIKEDNEIKAFASISATRKTNYRRSASIIIPSYEAFEFLRLCLESINMFSNNVEIIVVDNCSSPAVVKYLRNLERKKQVHLILNRANYGFSHAVNQGIQKADPNNDIIIINNDALVTPGWLEALREVVENVPDLGIAVPRQVLQPWEKTIKLHLPKVNEKKEVDVNLSAHHKNILDPLYDQVRGYVELTFAPFFCVYIPRETINEAGLLDVKNGPHYRSDRLYCDIVRNVYKRRIIYTPYSKVYHFHKRATEDLKLKNVELYKAMYELNDWQQIRYSQNG